MRVFEIDYDVNLHQQLHTSDPSDFKWLLKLRGLRAEDWLTPKMHIGSPQLAAPDFWSAEGELAFTPDPHRLPIDVYSHLEMAGQWLPIEVDGGPKLVILNVTQVANAVDVRKTRWTSTDNGQHIHVDHKPGSFVFHSDRLPESSIFKVPQNNYVQILCLERSGDPREEFKAAVESDGLKGLKFRLLWED